MGENGVAEDGLVRCWRGKSLPVPPRRVAFSKAANRALRQALDFLE